MANDIPLLSDNTFECFLTAIMYGADKIPDSWFDKVPGGFFRTKEDEERARKDKKKQERRARRHSEAGLDRDDHEDEPYYSDDYNDRGGRRRELGDYEVDGYGGRDRYERARGASMDATRGFVDGSPYPEPPFGRGHGQPGPYNPADYAAVDLGEKDGYRTGRAQGYDGTRFVAPGYVAGVAGAHHAENERPLSKSGPVRGYVPYAHLYDSPRGSPPPTKLQQDTGRSQHRDGYQPYVESAHATSESAHSRQSDGSRRHRHRHRENERDEARARHKSRARSAYGDRFDNTDRGLGYGTMGAVAGGLVGSELGNGGVLPTVAGAVASGLGANAYESRSKHKKDDHRGGRHDDRRDRDYDSRHDDSHRHRKHRSHRNDYHSD